MKFGEAIECARSGKRIAREGWNGKGMYVYMTRAHPVSADAWIERSLSHITEAEYERGYVIVEGHLDMMNAQGHRVIGWLASQTDMLADDWYVVEDKCTPEDE